MMTTYEFKISATCPVDGMQDDYDIQMDIAGMIQVEKMFDTIDMMTTQPVFQEDLTQKIFDVFEAQQVISVGTHSGVKTTCICL